MLTAQFQLILHKIIISSPAGYQFLMLSGFYDFPFVYHYYPVGVLYSA